MSERLLEVQDLKTHLLLRRGVVKVLDGVSFKIDKGEVLGLVGESGCGKSFTALSVLRLIPSPPGKIVGGKILFHVKTDSGSAQQIDLARVEQEKMHEYRGKHIAMILQDPMSSLNPVYDIGDQVGETLQVHLGYQGHVLQENIIEILKSVRIPNPEVRLRDYPHQFSGGMRQRVCLGISVSCNPQLLIADEPTTALDVTTQGQMLELLQSIQRDNGMAIMLITHNLGIVAQICDRVAVMYAGVIIEEGDRTRIFKEPMHPYTRGLMAAVPRLGKKMDRLLTIEGQPPNLFSRPLGCSFWPRCGWVMEKCKKEFPPATVLDERNYVRCWKYEPDSARNG
jgi:oligopeptide/dipeptide ABC transporter ATP-binding protein